MPSRGKDEDITISPVDKEGAKLLTPKTKDYDTKMLNLLSHSNTYEPNQIRPQ